jgi:hypothetical protein
LLVLERKDERLDRRPRFRRHDGLRVPDTFELNEPLRR